MRVLATATFKLEIENGRESISITVEVKHAFRSTPIDNLTEEIAIVRGYT